MSTGDMSDYMRGKMEVRRHGAKRESFMKDGFHKWAESSLPAREGQDEKEPAEKTDSYISMPGYGDKNASSLGYGRRGKGLPEFATKARSVYETAQVVVPFIRTVVDNSEFQKLIGEDFKNMMDTTLTFLKKIGLGHHTLKERSPHVAIRKRLAEMKKEGRGGASGGDMPSIDQIITEGQKIIQWLRDHNTEVKQALKEDIPKWLRENWPGEKVEVMITDPKNKKKKIKAELQKNNLADTIRSVGLAFEALGFGKPRPVMVKHAHTLIRKGMPHGEIVALLMKDHYLTKPEALEVLKRVGGRIGMGHEDSSSEEEEEMARPIAKKKGGKMASVKEKEALEGSVLDKGGRIGMGRKPSAFALYVKKYAAEHPGLGRSLMKEAAAAYKKRGGAKTPLRESEYRLEEKARGKDFTEAKALRLAKKAGKSESAYMEGGHGHRPQDDEYTFHGHPDSRVHDQSSGMKSGRAKGGHGHRPQDDEYTFHGHPDSRTSQASMGMTTGRGGRKPSAYALFVKEYSKKHPGLGKSLMKEAAAAWKARK